MDRYKTAARALLEAVFPSNVYCACCGSIIDKTRPYSLCDRCAAEIKWVGPKTCPVCGRALPDDFPLDTCYECGTAAHVFDAGWTCAEYGDAVKRCMMKLKYRGDAYIAEKFADAMADRMETVPLSADVIVPVPMSRRREKKRGYNQAALMAARFSELRGIPVSYDALARSRNTEAMSVIRGPERVLNVSGAFTAGDGHIGRGREPFRVSGAEILLIDDIITTGSTADACASALKQAGAKKVYLLTFACAGGVYI